MNNISIWVLKNLNGDNNMLDVVIDVETTGLGQKAGREDAIVEVGLAWRSNSGRVHTIGWLCNPGESYFEGGRADKALQINGLTKEQIFDAPLSEFVAQEVRHFRQYLVDHYQRVQLFAYNLEFEKSFLLQEPFDLNFSYGPCIMEKAKDKWNPGGRFLKLTNAIRNVDDSAVDQLLSDAHSAKADCHMALLLHETLG